MALEFIPKNPRNTLLNIVLYSGTLGEIIISVRTITSSALVKWVLLFIPNLRACFMCSGIPSAEGEGGGMK